MGNYFSYLRRSNDGVEVMDDYSPASYRFPPKSGSYFASHFMLAGEKFENMNLETFLFGENSDLNYLPKKPVSFPYGNVKPSEPSHTIRCLVHLRRDSFKLIRESTIDKSEELYRVEFTFDCDANCSIQVLLMAKEHLTQECVVYKPRKPEYMSEPVTFNKGCNQTYRSSLLINPDDFQPSELNYIPGSDEIPLLVQLSVQDPEYKGQSETTISGIEKLSDGSYTVKFMKQKIFVNGFCFITQEIYGIENKTGSNQEEDGDEDSNIECVICMHNLRDTLMLPCRHLCLCSTCAEQMRTKSSRCPICRANFHALLRIKAVRRKKRKENSTEHEELYEEVPLIEALNGGDALDSDAGELSGNAFKRRTLSARSRRSLSCLKSSRKTTAVEPLASGKIQADAVRCSEDEDQVIDSSLPGTPMVMESTPIINPISIQLGSEQLPAHVIYDLPAAATKDVIAEDVVRDMSTSGDVISRGTPACGDVAPRISEDAPTSVGVTFQNSQMPADVTSRDAPACADVTSRDASACADVKSRDVPACDDVKSRDAPACDDVKSRNIHDEALQGFTIADRMDESA